MIKDRMNEDQAQDQGVDLDQDQEAEEMMNADQDESSAIGNILIIAIVTN